MLGWCCVCCGRGAPAAQQQTKFLSAISRAMASAAGVIRFKGETQYRLVDEAGVIALQAQSRGTASGLVRKIEVDLIRTPVLRWRWRIDDTLQNNNERSKPGDDYPAMLGQCVRITTHPADQ